MQIKSALWASHPAVVCSFSSNVTELNLKGRFSTVRKPDILYLPGAICIVHFLYTRSKIVTTKDPHSWNCIASSLCTSWTEKPGPFATADSDLNYQLCAFKLPVVYIFSVSQCFSNMASICLVPFVLCSTYILKVRLSLPRIRHSCDFSVAISLYTSLLQVCFFPRFHVLFAQVNFIESILYLFTT